MLNSLMGDHKMNLYDLLERFSDGEAGLQEWMDLIMFVVIEVMPQEFLEDSRLGKKKSNFRTAERYC